jgi:hypothetical protein
VLAEQAIIGALLELSTERPAGMGIGMIPVSKVWQYLDRFGLPDWWEPVLLQADATLVARMNSEHKDKAVQSDQRARDRLPHGAVRAG